MNWDNMHPEDLFALFFVLLLLLVLGIHLLLS